MNTTHDDDFLTGGDTPKRSRGRPRGSRNKTEETIATEDGLKRMYNRMRPHITPNQRLYLEDVMAGKQGVDVMLEMELMVRQVALVFSETADVAWQSKRVSKEFTELINAFRMSMTDLEKIRSARDEAKSKQGNDVALEVLDAEAEEQFLTDLLARSRGEDDV